jgi:hypothetical protein
MTDRIIIADGKVTLETEEGQHLECPEAAMSDYLRSESEPPLDGKLLPDGVKWIDWRSPLLLMIHQYPPQLRQLRWILDSSAAPYGPEAKYQSRTLSLPYATTFAMFIHRGGRLTLGLSNEVFFSNEPIKSHSDKTLGYPALLNVSPMDGCGRQKAWICTQHLRHAKGADWRQQLDNLLQHMWNGGFNLSSEHHEGASWYGRSKGVHKSLHPVEAWERASKADKRFGLSVNWKRVGMSVGDIAESLFEEYQGGGEHLLDPTVLLARHRRDSKTKLFPRFLAGLRKAQGKPAAKEG